jgi:hypothetical protein
MLQLVLLVSQHKGIYQLLDSDTVNVDVPVIGRMSNIGHVVPRRASL